jgi:hypothetical protein
MDTLCNILASIGLTQKRIQNLQKSAVILIYRWATWLPRIIQVSTYRYLCKGIYPHTGTYMYLLAYRYLPVPTCLLVHTWLQVPTYLPISPTSTYLPNYKYLPAYRCLQVPVCTYLLTATYLPTYIYQYLSTQWNINLMVFMSKNVIHIWDIYVILKNVIDTVQYGNRLGDRWKFKAFLLWAVENVGPSIGGIKNIGRFSIFQSITPLPTGNFQ